MGGVCFGAGLGITLFGIMYMFIHDGMVHRRFPVSNAPGAHQAEKFENLPVLVVYCMLLGACCAMFALAEHAAEAQCHISVRACCSNVHQYLLGWQVGTGCEVRSMLTCRLVLLLMCHT